MSTDLIAPPAKSGGSTRRALRSSPVSRLLDRSLSLLTWAATFWDSTQKAGMCAGVRVLVEARSLNRSNPMGAAHMYQLPRCYVSPSLERSDGIRAERPAVAPFTNHLLKSQALAFFWEVLAAFTHYKYARHRLLIPAAARRIAIVIVVGLLTPAAHPAKAQTTNRSGIDLVGAPLPTAPLDTATNRIAADSLRPRNTCRGSTLVARILGGAAGGALSGALIYIPVKALSDGSRHSIGRTIIGGGAVLGAAIIGVASAFHVGCHDIVATRR